MSLLIDHQNINIGNGPTEFGPANVPDGVTLAKLSLARKTSGNNLWPNEATLIDATIVISLDGGVTYPFSAGGMTAAGGLLVIQGVELAEQWIEANCPPGIGRRAKAIVNVTNGPLRSEITIEVT